METWKMKETTAKKEQTAAKRLITVDELAEITATSKAKWFRHIWAGDCPLPIIRLGRSIRFDMADVERYLEKSTVPAGK